MGVWEVLMFIPNLFASLFIPPASEDIQSLEDLIYEYGQAVLHIPQLFRRLAFKTRTLEEELKEAMLRGNLRKSFSQFDLIMLGLAIMVGGSGFAFLGQAVALFAGSAVIISTLIMGVICLCVGACYSELAVEYPIAGSAFTYVMVTFGELPAFITMGFLLVEYVVGMAAVSRGFSAYLAMLCDEPGNFFVYNYSDDKGLDYMAFAAVIILTLILILGVRETAPFISIVTVIKLTLMVFICVMGYVKAQGGVFLEDFGLPEKGVDGVFEASALMLFPYLPVDVASIAAEESRRVEYIPVATLGAIGIAGLLYLLQGLCLTNMVTANTLMDCTTPYGDYQVSLYNTTEGCRDPMTDTCGATTPPSVPGYKRSFIYAFNLRGFPFMQYVVASASLLGIITGLIVGLYSVSRLTMVAAREWLLPPILARISPRTQTPVIAQIVMGVFIAVLALIVPYGELAEIVNFGALFSMWTVTNVLLYRRYYPEVKMRYTQHGTIETAVSASNVGFKVPGAKLSVEIQRILVALHLVLLNAVCIGFTIFYRLTSSRNPVCTADGDGGDDQLKPLLGQHNSVGHWYFVLAWFILNVTMLLSCPLAYEPQTWAVHRWLLPWVPSFANLLICYTLTSLSVDTLKASAIYAAILVFVYIVFSMPLSFIRHFKIGKDDDDLEVVEITYQGGKWQEVDDVPASTTVGQSSGPPSTLITPSATSSIPIDAKWRPGM